MHVGQLPAVGDIGIGAEGVIHGQLRARVAGQEVKGQRDSREKSGGEEIARKAIPDTDKARVHNAFMQ